MKTVYSPQTKFAGGIKTKFAGGITMQMVKTLIRSHCGVGGPDWVYQKLMIIPYFNLNSE